MANFIGDANNNLLTGGPGDDYFFGGPGNDTLIGGAGNDLLDGDSDDDVIDGGEGADRTVLYLRPAPAGVTYTLGDGTVNTTLGKKTLTSIEGADIFGTNFADNITGGSATDYIWARDGNDLVNGGGGDDYLFGEVGNDTLYGGSGNDLIYGDIDNDYLFGDFGNDTLNGGSGDDDLDGHYGDDIIDGGPGTDRTVLYLLPAPGGVNYTLGDGTIDTTVGKKTLISIEGADIFGTNFADTITGGSATDYVWARDDNDIVNGGGGNDFLYGEVGNDRLDGGGGDDRIDGGDGDDTLIGGSGNNVLIGGTGSDTVDYSASTAVLVDLRSSASSASSFDIFSSIENAIGSAYADTLVGSPGANRLVGGLGDDLLFGGLGSDILDGEGGVDTAAFYLEPWTQGSYLLRVGSGSDFGKLFVALVDGTLSETIFEITSTPAGVVTVSGVGARTNQGTDVLTNVERLLFSTQPAQPWIDPKAPGYLAIDVTFGPQLIGTDQSDIFVGSLGQDSASGRGGADALYGYGGNDQLDGGAGDDLLVGGDGDDTLVGGSGNNLLLGGAGTDTAEYSATAGVVADLRGNWANTADSKDVLVAIENLVGSAYGDSLVGSAGANRLFSGAGDDFLAGGLGNDTVDGGAGSDYAAFYLEPSTQGSYSLRIGTGTDRGKLFVIVTNGTFTETVFDISVVPDGIVTVTGLGARAQQGADQLANIERLLFTTQAADPYASPTLPGYLTIEVLSGNRIVGTDKAEVLLGTASHDVLNGGGGSNALYGFEGDDTFLADQGQNLFDGGAGRDKVSYSSAASPIRVDLTTGTVEKSNGSDTLVSIEEVIGSNFNDIIDGDSSNNVLDGWYGDDRIFGGGGSDTISGGSGVDTYVYKAITDSLPSAPDLIQFSGKWALVLDPFKGKYVKAAGEGDKIDVSAIDADILTPGDQAFTWAQNPSGAAGQMYSRYDAQSNLTRLFLDVNGDTIADMIILIKGQPSLSGADFVL